LGVTARIRFSRFETLASDIRAFGSSCGKRKVDEVYPVSRLFASAKSHLTLFRFFEKSVQRCCGGGSLGAVHSDIENSCAVLENVFRRHAPVPKPSPFRKDRRSRIVRFEFKSVRRLGSFKLNSVVTTTYDLADVRDHSVELTLGQWLPIFLFPFHRSPDAWKLMLVWGIAGALGLWLCIGWSPFERPLLFFGIYGTGILLLWLGAGYFAFDALLQDLARRERGVGKSVEFEIVKTAKWEAFVRRMKPQD
jgi:hypothetical protein